MSSPISAGIAGAGLMGRWHAHAIRRAGGRVMAICDPDLAAAQELAGRLSGAQPTVASDLADLDPELVDVWHICTPSSSHAALCRASIEAGRHVMVEKPLAPTAPEVALLIAAATEQNVLLCPVHQFPFQDGVQRARRLLPDLGRVVGVHYTMRSAGGRDLSPAEVDALVLEILPHPFSLLEALWPGILRQLKWRVLRPGVGEQLLIGTAKGIGCSISTSMAGRPTANRCEIVADGGTIHLDLFHGYALVEPGAVSRTRKTLQPFALSSRRFTAAGLNLGRRLWRREPAYPGLNLLVRSFYAAIRGAAPAPISPQAVLAVAQACDQIQRSLQVAT